MYLNAKPYQLSMELSDLMSNSRLNTCGGGLIHFSVD